MNSLMLKTDKKITEDIIQYLRYIFRLKKVNNKAMTDIRHLFRLKKKMKQSKTK